MQNKNLRMFAVIVGLLLSVSLVACSSKSSSATPPSPPITTSPTANVSVPSAATANVSPCDKSTLTQADCYLQSPARAQRFQTTVRKAGVKIAQALQSGKFGPVFRYNSLKTALQPGQVGYGGISSNNKQAFAWVYWTADGSIDYTKPIDEISLRNANGNPATEVLFLEPNGPYSKVSDIGTYWQVFKNLDNKTVQVSDTFNLQFDDSVAATSSSAPSANPQFVYPYTLDQFKQLDNEAFDQLAANMTSNFGTS